MKLSIIKFERFASKSLCLYFSCVYFFVFGFTEFRAGKFQNIEEFVKGCTALINLPSQHPLIGGDYPIHTTFSYNKVVTQAPEPKGAFQGFYQRILKAQNKPDELRLLV